MARLATEWLNQHLSEPLSVAEMVTALEAAGIEVDEVVRPPEFDPLIVAAAIKDVKPHPNADRLQMVIVELGGQDYQVVCGAPNLRAGQLVAFAQVGAKLPDGTQIAHTKIRGHDSYGMLCSEKELALGGGHEEILDLGEETEPGTPLSEVFSAEESMINVSTAANRWDLQSYQGIAREVAAHTHVDALDQTVPLSPSGEKVDDLFINKVSEEVPCYGLLKLRLKDPIASSPAWMQRRLRSAGLRPVNVVVDITNYVMCETGQPLHAFDSANVKGQVTIRFADSNEQITTLDETKRTLTNEDLVIADNKGAIALAGVMGGQSSEIKDSTREILVEAATFSDTLVRKTAKRHGIRTEASSRFERGVPVQAVRQALRYAVHLLQEYAEGELVSYQNELNVWPWVQHIGVRKSRLQTLLGLEVEAAEVVDSLRSLQFDVEDFDIAEEARKHLGKPYKWGARYRTDGVRAFDCGYLVDYLYSLIGHMVGHSAPQIMSTGEEVELEDIQIGDTLYRDGAWKEVTSEERDGVSHVALYIGEGQIIHAENYARHDGEWQEMPKDEQQVRIDPIEVISEDPQFLGARRHVDDLSDYIAVTVPWWRPDVRDAADVAEEVIKLVGLDKLPSTLPPWRPEKVDNIENTWSRLAELRRILQGLGLFEITTYPFISQDDIKTYQSDIKSHLKLQNPRSQEQAYLRRSLLPSLVNSVVNNSTYKDNFGVFEVAKVFLPHPDDALPVESSMLGIALTSTDSRLHIKNLIDQIMKLLHIQPDFIATGEQAALHPARQAKIEVNGVTVGCYGELHPKIIQTHKLKNGVSYAELDMQRLYELWSTAHFRELPKYQSSYRDVAITVDKSVTWQQLRTSIDKLDGVSARFRDEFDKEKKKVITVHLELEAREATLTDEDIKSRLKAVQTAVKRDTDGEAEL